MPIFEYRCHACGHLTEKIQRVPQQKMPCPQCGGDAQRAISKPSATTNSCVSPAGSRFT